MRRVTTRAEGVFTDLGCDQETAEQLDRDFLERGCFSYLKVRRSGHRGKSCKVTVPGPRGEQRKEPRRLHAVKEHSFCGQEGSMADNPEEGSKGPSYLRPPEYKCFEITRKANIIRQNMPILVA